MNKRTHITLFLLLLVIWGVFLFFYKIRDLDSDTLFETRTFMRNLTWQTDFRTSVPYKKGDDVEYTWVFSGKSPYDISVDIAVLKNNLDIEQIELDGQSIPESSLSNIRTTDSSILKITGKAKNTNNSGGDIPKAKIIAEPVKKEKIVPVPEKTNPTTTSDASALKMDRTKFNSNINNLITIHGKDLESVEFVNIGEKRIRPVYSSGSLFVQIDRDTFASGEYFVFYTQKNGKIITSDERLSFEYSDSPINIANITPASIPNTEDTFVVIQGNGFDKIVSIQLSNNLILKNAEFKIINNQVAGVKIPKDLPPGSYYFNIMDTGSIYELKNMRFVITHP